MAVNFINAPLQIVLCIFLILDYFVGDTRNLNPFGFYDHIKILSGWGMRESLHLSVLHLPVLFDNLGKARTWAAKIQNRFFLLTDVIIEIVLYTFIHNRLLLFTSTLHHVTKLSVDCLKLVYLSYLRLFQFFVFK